MDGVLFQSIWTVIVFVTFIGIVFWAYSSGSKKRFEEAANLIMEDDSPKNNNKQEKS